MTKQRRVFDPRDFIRSPFVTCPACGADQLGVLQVHSRHMIRRCRECLGPSKGDSRARVLLPKIRKRILYLDQFALSNAMYRAFPDIDAERHARASGWSEAVEKMQLLVRIQALVCPHSDLHVDETLPFAHSGKLQNTWTMLSSGTRFDDIFQIERQQLVRCAELWELNEPIEPASILRDPVVSPDPDGWADVLTVVVPLDFYNQIKEDIAAARSSLAASLHPIFEQWASDHVEFEEQFEVELASFGPTILRMVADFENRKVEFWSGRGDLPMPTNSVLHFKAIQNLFARLGYAEDEAVARAQAFLLSDAPHAVPKVRLSAMLFAGLARKLASGMKPAKLTDGMDTDVKAVSAFLPYCDGIMVDGLVAGLLCENPVVDLVRSHGTRVFSARELDEFVEWLNELAAEIDADHLETVAMVYGCDVVDAFEEAFG